MSMNMTAEKNAPAFDTSVTIAGVTLKNPVMTASHLVLVRNIVSLLI